MMKFCNANKKWLYATIFFLISLLVLIFILKRPHNFLIYLSNDYSSFIGALTGALVAGIIAFYVSKWQINKQSKIQSEAIINEHLFNLKRRFIDEFSKMYFTLFDELFKPININLLQIIDLKECINNGTVRGKQMDLKEFIKNLKELYEQFGTIDLNTFSNSLASLSSLILANEHIDKNINELNIRIKLFSDADLDYLFNNLIKSWSNILNNIKKNSSVDDIIGMIGEHEVVINELSEKLESHYNDIQLVIMRLQKDIYYQLINYNKNDIVRQMLELAYKWYCIDEMDKCYDLCKDSLKYESTARAYQLMGWTFSENININNNSKKYRNALKCFNKALKIDSNNKCLLENKVEILEAMGRSETALKFYKKRLILNFDENEVLQEMAEKLIICNKFEEAEKYFKLALKVKPENIFINKLLEIILSVLLEGNNQDIEDVLQSLKRTNDWEDLEWSISDLSLWINDEKRSKHLPEKQKIYIKNLISAIELELK